LRTHKFKNIFGDLGAKLWTKLSGGSNAAQTAKLAKANIDCDTGSIYRKDGASAMIERTAEKRAEFKKACMSVNVQSASDKLKAEYKASLSGLAKPAAGACKFNSVSSLVKDSFDKAKNRECLCENAEVASLKNVKDSALVKKMTKVAKLWCRCVVMKCAQHEDEQTGEDCGDGCRMGAILRYHKGDTNMATSE
jgi:hypothetical protein